MSARISSIDAEGFREMPPLGEGQGERFTGAVITAHFIMLLPGMPLTCHEKVGNYICPLFAHFPYTTTLLAPMNQSTNVYKPIDKPKTSETVFFSQKVGNPTKGGKMASLYCAPSPIHQQLSLFNVTTNQRQEHLSIYHYELPPSWPKPSILNTVEIQY